MANAREIKSRINSVQDTMKITNAMYMISSSKMKKAKKILSDTEPYFYNWMTVSDVGKYYEDFFEDFSMEKYRQMISRMELTAVKARS